MMLPEQEKDEMIRVKFFSREDISVSYYTKRLEVVDQAEFCETPSFIDLIEYKNIIDFYENFSDLPFIKKLIKLKSDYYTEINKHYKLISEANIKDIFNILENNTNYDETDFIKLVQKFNKFSLFDETEIEFLISKPTLDWKLMLEDKKICSHIKKNKNYKNIIELNVILLRTIVMEYIYFEKLSIINNEEIDIYIGKYIAKCQNVIDLLDIENTKLPVDAQLKLKAKNNRKKLENNKILICESEIEYCFEFSNNVDKLIQNQENEKYSEIWNFDQILTNNNTRPISYKDIYVFCIHFLGLLNPIKNISNSSINCDSNQGQIIPLPSQYNSYTSKNSSYKINSIFTLNRLNLLISYLKINNINIFQFLNYIIEILMPKGFYTIMDSENYYTNSLISINKHLCTQIDSILSQYECYQKYGRIDKELINLNGSKSINFQSYNSLIGKKNIYPSDWNIYFQMMDSQSLYSVAITENSKHLFEDIKKGKILKSDILTYINLGIASINYFLEKQVVYWDSNILKFVDNKIANVMENLFKYGSIPIFELSSCEELYDKLKNNSLIKVDSKLFNKYEIEYFHYILNDRDHNDSLALRNEYMHNGEVRIDDEQANLQLIEVLLEIIIKIQYEFDFYKLLVK